MKFGKELMLGIAMTSGAMDANAEEGTKSTSSSPDAKPIKIEETSTLEKEGMYIDNTAEKNKISLDLEKNEKEIKAHASAIKNKFYSYSYANEKLKEIMKYKFQTIEIAEEYLSDVFNPKYANLTKFFDDGPSKGFPDLAKLNTLLNNHTTILNKLGELNSLADCYAPVVLEPVVRPALEGERTTVEAVTPIQKPKEFIPNNPTNQPEIRIDPKHKSKLGYVLQGLGDDAKNVAKTVLNVFVDDGCNRCGPPGGEIWR